MNNTTPKPFVVACAPGHGIGNQLPIYSRHETEADAWGARKRGGRGVMAVECHDETCEFLWKDSVQSGLYRFIA